MRWHNQDIPDQAILTYIENSERFQRKVRKLFARMDGTMNTGKPSPELRSEHLDNNK